MMPFYTASYLKHVATTRAMPYSKRSILTIWRCGSTQILRSPGRDFLVCTRFFTLTVATQLPLDAMRQRKLWNMRRNSNRTHPKPCSSRSEERRVGKHSRDRRSRQLVQTEHK